MLSTRQILMITLGALLTVLVWRNAPLIGLWLSGPPEPRVVAARGELAADERATIEIFEAARDSVVSITTRARVVDPFRMRSFEQPRGTGSGFIWDPFGHVVTNNHVVQGASSATVLLNDGRSFDARLVGRAPSHDLAVLRIDAGNLPPPVPVGSSTDLQVGQKVFAIGNPFGLDWTLTTGIVSALDRELPGEAGRPIRGLVQTDAAINPGNSGGPLLDSAGRLIGVNTAIFSPSGASAGIGFAVPVGSVNRVVPQLIERGRYSPPTIGVRYDPVLNAAANRQGIDGVVVLGVEDGSPAAGAGIAPAELLRDGRAVPRDVIVGIGEIRIATVDDLVAALDRRSAGEKITVVLRRDGREREVRLELTRSG